MKLSNEARKALESTGITHARIIEEYIASGQVVMVLSGRNVMGDTMYATWRDGESAADLKWVYERHNA